LNQQPNVDSAVSSDVAGNSKSIAAPNPN
jgi:hypothetical protein